MSKLKPSVWAVITAVSTFTIAVGEFTSAVNEVTNASESLQRMISNEFDYNRIQSLQVGINSEFVETKLPQPIAIRHLETEIGRVEVKHYAEEKYWLSLFVQQKKLLAYTVISKKIDFQPSIDHTGMPAVQTRLGQVVETPESQIAEQARTGSLYLEMESLNRSQQYLNGYFGYIEGGALPSEFNQDQFNRRLGEVNLVLQNGGQFESLSSSYASFREQVPVNFFGVGVIELSLEKIHQGTLSALERQLFDIQS